MKAVIPDHLGSIAWSDVPEPVIGRNDVLVSVEAFSVNRGETFLLDAPPSRWRPGKDVAGSVIDVGQAITGLVRGQRIVAHPEHSGWAERVGVSADRVATLPQSIPSSTAAALPLAGLTALRLIRVIGDVPGRSMLITGASGGVGHYFVELAAHHGARVTALCSSVERGQRLLELGAQELITDIADARGRFDVVIESVGGELFPAAWRLLRSRGLFVWMGQASRTPPTIDFFDWAGGANATLRKFLYSESEVSDGEDLATLVRLVSTGRLHPEISVVADWAETKAVIGDLLARRIRGNAVLEVTASSAQSPR
jgi:NADPH:quinone reductase-like Zn-dependent oxidoreductase